METAVQNSGVWSGLSKPIAETIEAVQDSIVTVHGGGRSTASGVVWRPGVIVTVRHGLRRSDSLQAAHHGDPFPATLAGADAGTDLAVLRVDSSIGKPAESIGSQPTRVGEVVLAVGRSALGDISASAGIVARLGSGWRTWRGGQMDRLIRRGCAALRWPVGQRTGERRPSRVGHQQFGAGTERSHHRTGSNHRPSGGCNSGTGPCAAPLSWRCYASRSCSRGSALALRRRGRRGVAGTARGSQCACGCSRNAGG